MQIEDIVCKTQILQVSIDNLIKHADSYVLKVEKKGDISLVSSSNDLWKLSKEKLVEIQELESLGKTYL